MVVIFDDITHHNQGANYSEISGFIGWHSCHMASGFYDGHHGVHFPSFIRFCLLFLLVHYDFDGFYNPLRGPRACIQSIPVVQGRRTTGAGIKYLFFGTRHPSEYALKSNHRPTGVYRDKTHKLDQGKWRNLDFPNK